MVSSLFLRRSYSTYVLSIYYPYGKGVKLQMYAIFLFNTINTDTPIVNREINFYCRTIGVEPTLLDVVTKLTETVGKESMYTKEFHVEDFQIVQPGIYMRYLDWNQTAIMVVKTDAMSAYDTPIDLFNMTAKI